jgi:hypothetical protein
MGKATPLKDISKGWKSQRKFLVAACHRVGSLAINTSSTAGSGMQLFWELIVSGTKVCPAHEEAGNLRAQELIL